MTWAPQFAVVTLGVISRPVDARGLRWGAVAGRSLRGRIRLGLEPHRENAVPPPLARRCETIVQVGDAVFAADRHLDLAKRRRAGRPRPLASCGRSPLHITTVFRGKNHEIPD